MIPARARAYERPLRVIKHGRRMLTPPGYRKRLRADVERWAGAGLISRTAADSIIEETKTDSSQAIVTVLAFVLAILAAVGLIALVAANWNEIPREIRVAGLLAINLVALGTCLAFSLMRKTGSIAFECSAALSVMSAAASISLIGQIYHFPSNWPGFGLAMMCIAGATALIARSSACLWLAAVAQATYHGANVSEAPGGLFGTYGAAFGEQWTRQHWIFLGFSILLIAIAVSRWTARSGPWTVFVAMLPLFWWLGSLNFFPVAPGRSLALTACGIVVAVVLAHELRVSDRYEAATSALIGLFAIGVAALCLRDQLGPNYADRATDMSAWRGLLAAIDMSGWRGLLAIAAAAALALLAAVRRYPDRAALLWLAAALAAPFVASHLVPADPRAASPLGAIFRLVLEVMLPLALLAVEARLSERRKTFAFAIAAVIAIACYQVWETRDLLALAWVFLGGSVVLGAAILVSRMWAARLRPAAGEGAG